MTFAVFGIAIGGLCALLRYRAPMVLVLSASLAVGAVLGGFLFHTHIWAIVANAFGSIVALQFSYAAVGLTSQLVLSRKMIPHADVKKI